MESDLDFNSVLRLCPLTPSGAAMVYLCGIFVGLALGRRTTNHLRSDSMEDLIGTRPVLPGYIIEVSFIVKNNHVLNPIDPRNSAHVLEGICRLTSGRSSQCRLLECETPAQEYNLRSDLGVHFFLGSQTLSLCGGWTSKTLSLA